jgi:putative transcriptional regulator
MKRPRKTRKALEESGYLDGQLLIAMPSMRDKRFARAVIYMCAHSEEGAMGLIINQQASNLSFTDLLDQLKIVPGRSSRPDAIVAELANRPVMVGGPVETGRGFVLHSSDYFAPESTLSIDEGICLTATVDILRAIASGQGPARCLLALGYSGWAAGQLESEIQANGWLSCPADADLVFGTDLAGKYQRALAKLGIDPGFLIGDVGHA